MNIILPGHLIAKYKALATYRFLITSQNSGKGQVILKAAHQAAQSAFEPGDQATAGFFETPMLGAGLHSYFFQWVWDDTPHQCIRRRRIDACGHNQNQAFPTVGRSRLWAFRFEAAAFDHEKHRLYSPARTIIQYRPPAPEGNPWL
ncbi:MAG: hypothetical protein LUQ29_08155 [Methylococcaceae bacterium]|nr:hypothetical protein [Methylococcaceae bacterium]